MKKFSIHEDPHRRFNPLLNEWVLVSPHRNQRPWQGKNEDIPSISLPDYDDTCYLCPGNKRANGIKNPDYNSTFVFDNDFAALKPEALLFDAESATPFFKVQPERGIARVVCFSPKHHLTLPEMELSEIEALIETWQEEYRHLGNLDFINYIQIFENKGAIMGCSNPHPHGQIWAQSSLPTQVEKTQQSQKVYFEQNGNTLLQDYLKEELNCKDRVVLDGPHFAVIVPFWAIWPFETIIISKRPIGKITDFSAAEKAAFAKVLKQLTIKYDNLFEISFPYSSGIHQAPTDGVEHPEWHFHMHFYPPLLRSATVKKFMVGYEMLGEAQRDITPEKSAEILRLQSEVHYSIKNIHSKTK
jgi:UDPglucose--hexose-1-phosphate uridylyltransferase